MYGATLPARMTTAHGDLFRDNPIADPGFDPGANRPGIPIIIP